jgi:hypothetical protein
LFCLIIAVVTFASAIGISIRHCLGRSSHTFHWQPFTYALSGAVGSVVVFTYLGALAGSLSQQGFVWQYLPIGLVPGAILGISTYWSLKKSRRLSCPEG